MSEEKKKKVYTKKCKRCGESYETTNKNGKVCPACRPAVLRENGIKGREARTGGPGKHYADKSVEATSVKTIKRARKKPRGVSDVRWRMELRRRANPEYYNQFGSDCK